MGKFDGIIIASDFDGTLYCNGKISQKNLDAIAYFQREGGKFTICSGRPYEFIRDFDPPLPINTYAITTNGASIIDIPSKEILYEGFCDDHLFEIVDKIIEDDLGYGTFTIFSNVEPRVKDYSLEEYVLLRPTLNSGTIYKIDIRSTDEKLAQIGAKTVNNYDLGEYIAVQSWKMNLEIWPRKNAKGAALKRLKERLGATLAIGVGDYENDIELLLAADVGYAVSNSNDVLFAYADRIAPNEDGSAIAYIIDELDKTYI
jgi:Cof subfamily protein (haloacid dehalogenase superfamily)